MIGTKPTRYVGASLTFQPEGSSSYDFGTRLGDLIITTNLIEGGERWNGIKAKIARTFTITCTALHFSNADIAAFAQMQSKIGTVTITDSKGRESSHPDYQFEHNFKKPFTGKESFRQMVAFTKVMNPNNLEEFITLDPTILRQVERSGYELIVAEDEIPVTITSITASVSPYTTATVVTSSAHGLTVGNFILISGNTQTLYNSYAIVLSVVSTTSFTINVPVASPTSGTGGTLTDFSKQLISQVDYKIQVKDDFSCLLFIKNWLGKDLDGDYSWAGWPTWKTKSTTWYIAAPSDDPDATIAETGFGRSGWTLNSAGHGDYPAFSHLSDDDYQLLAYITLDSNWSDIFAHWSAIP